MSSILVVDDEREIRDAVKDYLELKGYGVQTAICVKDAEQVFRRSRPDAVISDYSLPDGDALQLLAKIKAADSNVPFLVLTGHGSIDLAVRAIKEGAEQFLTKPVQLETLLVALKRTLENTRLRRVHQARKSRETRDLVDPFMGSSRSIQQLAEEARKVLPGDRPILVLGETGTGKGVLSRWLHANSSRSEEAFVDLNCAGFQRELLESELFGHEKGAFTSAVTSKPGLFEVAHRGTVFLDEIGDIDPQIQPKLLKVLEERQFRRLGEVRDREVDIRLVAATHQDIKSLVQANRFRSDLYFRISTLPLLIPPLRERLEDLEVLAKHLLQQFAMELRRATPALSGEAMQSLRSYSWPGNIRELRNVLERALLLSDKETLEAKDLRFETRDTSDSQDTERTLSEQEKYYIESVLKKHRWRVREAAKVLGLARSSLYHKMKVYGIVAPEPTFE